jgi:Zn-dependent protease with chaperone function
MHELDFVLPILSFAYAAAGIGLVSALLARAWARRQRRFPSAGEATWCAFLPPLALLLLPLSAVEPHFPGTLNAVHLMWHSWEQALHAAPLAHGMLHAANSLLLVLAATGLVRMAYALARMRGFASALRTAGTTSPEFVDGVPLRTIDSPRPLCFTTGLLRPSVYLSTGLRELLSPQEREAMLAHEAAHLHRGDSLVRTFLFLFYALFPLPGSRLLLADWHHAVERECDALAARRIGSAPDVASALIRMAQAAARSAVAVPDGACFAALGDDIEGRVEALLALPASHSRARPTPLVLLGLGFLLTGSLWISHAVELFVRH